MRHSPDNELASSRKSHSRCCQSGLVGRSRLWSSRSPIESIKFCVLMLWKRSSSSMQVDVRWSQHIIIHGCNDKWNSGAYHVSSLIPAGFSRRSVLRYGGQKDRFTRMQTTRICVFAYTNISSTAAAQTPQPSHRTWSIPESRQRWLDSGQRICTLSASLDSHCLRGCWA